MSENSVNIVKINAFPEKLENVIDDHPLNTVCVKLVFVTESENLVVGHVPAVVKEGRATSRMIFRVQLLRKLIKKE